MSIRIIFVILFFIGIFWFYFTYFQNSKNVNTNISDIFIFIKNFLISIFLFSPILFMNKMEKEFLKYEQNTIYLEKIPEFQFKLLVLYLLLSSFNLYIIEKFIGVGFSFFILSILEFLYSLSFYFDNFFCYCEMYFNMPSVEIIKQRLNIFLKMLSRFEFKKTECDSDITMTLFHPETNSWELVFKEETIPNRYSQYLDQKSGPFIFCFFEKITESINEISSSFCFDDYNKLLSILDFFYDFLDFFEKDIVDLDIDSIHPRQILHIDQLKYNFISRILNVENNGGDYDENIFLQDFVFDPLN